MQAVANRSNVRAVALSTSRPAASAMAPRRAVVPRRRLHAQASTKTLERPTQTSQQEQQQQQQQQQQQEAQVAPPAPRPPKSGGGGHKGATGPFAPLVVATRGVIGEKEFNKFRGKAISLHSQVIKEFCKLFGVENRQVQGVIRLAKKNGETLGFLA